MSEKVNAVTRTSCFLPKESSEDACSRSKDDRSDELKVVMETIELRRQMAAVWNHRPGAFPAGNPTTSDHPTVSNDSSLSEHEDVAASPNTIDAGEAPIVLRATLVPHLSETEEENELVQAEPLSFDENGNKGPTAQTSCGFQRQMLWCLLIVGFLLIVVGVLGAVLGAVASENGSSSSSSSNDSVQPPSGGLRFLRGFG